MFVCEEAGGGRSSLPGSHRSMVDLSVRVVRVLTCALHEPYTSPCTSHDRTPIRGYRVLLLASQVTQYVAS